MILAVVSTFFKGATLQIQYGFIFFYQLQPFLKGQTGEKLNFGEWMPLEDTAMYLEFGNISY